MQSKQNANRSTSAKSICKSAKRKPLVNKLKQFSGGFNNFFLCISMMRKKKQIMRRQKSALGQKMIMYFTNRSTTVQPVDEIESTRNAKHSASGNIFMTSDDRSNGRSIIKISILIMGRHKTVTCQGGSPIGRSFYQFRLRGGCDKQNPVEG